MCPSVLQDMNAFIVELRRADDMYHSTEEAERPQQIDVSLEVT